MRLSSCWLSALALSAALLAPSSSRADTTYQVSLGFGNSTVTGTVTTNGAKGGANGMIEISSWSFGVQQGSSTGGFSSADREGSAPSVSEITVTNDLTADDTHIYFNFGSGDGGSITFSEVLPNGAIQFFCIGQITFPCTVNDPEGFAAANIAGDGQFDFQSESGTQIIGTVIPSPEPATTTLVLFGALFSLLTRRHRIRNPR